MAVSGSFDVIVDDGTRQHRFFLNRSYYGLYVPGMIWRKLENFSSGRCAWCWPPSSTTPTTITGTTTTSALGRRRVPVKVPFLDLARCDRRAAPSRFPRPSAASWSRAGTSSGAEVEAFERAWAALRRSGALHRRRRTGSTRSHLRCGPAASAPATRSSSRPTPSSPPGWRVTPRRRHPGSGRARPRHLQPRPRRGSQPAITPRTRRDHARAPLRPAGRHGSRSREVADAPRAAGARGRGPGPRRPLRRPARRAAWATPPLGASTRARTSGALGDGGGGDHRRRRRWPTRCARCATTARPRSTSTSRRLQQPARRAAGGGPAGEAGGARRVERASPGGRRAATSPGSTA